VGRGCSRDGSFNLATVVWENEKDKKLVLPVPFGCAIDCDIEDARDEAENAIPQSGGLDWLDIVKSV
jgi:hypothetical protein